MEFECQIFYIYSLNAHLILDKKGSHISKQTWNVNA